MARAGWREKHEVTVFARPLARWTDEELLRVLEAEQGTAALEDPDETPGEA